MNNSEPQYIHLGGIDSRSWTFSTFVNFIYFWSTFMAYIPVKY